MHMGAAGEEAMHACVYAWEAAEMPEMLYHAHALGVQHMHLGRRGDHVRVREQGEERRLRSSGPHPQLPNMERRCLIWSSVA